MVIITGRNLGERQRELNYKVGEVVANKKSFNDIKIEHEATDIDKLYKIDIASKCKDIDYIVEILKSGDSLYISRVLKCVWLYHANYSHIINPEYLHDNIFPYMSIKMKNKMLSTISMHVRDEDRAAQYFFYCKRNGMPNIAKKFLIFSSEEFKLNSLKNVKSFNLYSFINVPINLQNLVGNSFKLARTCIETYEGLRTNIIHNSKHLYSINNEKYLEILEQYQVVHLNHPNALERLGIRISRDIMLKHKNRVLKNPLLYANMLNKCMLVKYSSKSEAKIYMKSLIPQHVGDFWHIDFCTAYNYILNLIPINEKFEYIKQLFTTSYPGEAFEMTIDFYNLKYYNILSIDQRETWALRHIDEQKEILGSGNDYIWYKFVNIDKALIEISKYIMITPDNHKRSDIVNILVEAAKDHKDLKKVLDYYYQRHINENEQQKNNFIDKILSVHNVFEFNMECWEAFNKLLHSLNIYSVGNYKDKIYMAVAVFCHILHKTNMPQALMDFVDLDINYSYFSLIMNKLSKEKSDIIFQYLLNLFLDKIKPFEQDPSNKKLREKLIKYVHNIFNLLNCFQKEDKECPDIVRKFMDIHSPKPKKPATLTAKELFRYIKTDAHLVVEVLDHADVISNDCRRTFNSTLRKLKVYFSNDVAKAYINFLDRIILKSTDDYNSHKVINDAIFGIFQLADENFKATLMEKYHPSKPKIEHSVVDRKKLYVQEAICRFMGYSRPPVPLTNVLKYVKGDYVHFCLPMFNMYVANLPIPLVMKFIEGILNSPLSIQKHALRLAFTCYTTENLNTLVLNTWKKSKNVSMRRIIYKSLFNKLTEQTSLEDDNNDAQVLYKTLIFFTSDLHQDDHEDLFELICFYTRRLPNKFIDDYLQTAWHMVIKLPKKTVNIDRQIKLISTTERNLELVQKDFVRKRIIDEHVYEALDCKRLRPDELQKIQNLWSAKWNVIANYILRYSDNEELEQSLELVRIIFKKCLEMWNDRYKESYIFQKFYFDFIICLVNKSHDLWYDNPKKSCSVPIFELILEMLQESLPLKEIYLIIWNLKVTIYIETGLNVVSTAYDDGDQVEPLSSEETLCDKIANCIKVFVQELLVKRHFYSIYLPEIASLIKQKLQDLRDLKNLDIYFCQSLANIGLKETYLLALMILPTDVSEEMREIHTGTVKKIHAFENEEIQSYLHFKFFSSYYNYL